MRKIDVLKRFRADKAHLVLVDTSPSSRRWVRKTNPRFKRKIGAYQAWYKRKTEGIVSTYIVISSESPPANGYRASEYSLSPGFDANWLEGIIFADFIREIQTRLDRLGKKQVGELRVDNFEVSKKRIREQTYFQIGTGVYRWNPFIKSVG